MEGVSLKKELKQWEHNFIKKYNRSPKRNDIDKLPTIKLKYKTYSKLKNQQIRVNKTPIKNDFASDDTIHTDLTDELSDLINEEFGPTPQIYGKSISLFEINLSPVKKKLDLSGIDDLLNETDEDDTINISQNEEDIMDNILLDNKNNYDNLSIRHEPKHVYGPNSPLKIESNLKLHQTTPRRNLNLELIEKVTPLGISPSPLFKRSLTKSLRELENEFQTVRKELKLDEIAEEKDGTQDQIDGQKEDAGSETTDNNSIEDEQENSVSSDTQGMLPQKRRRRGIIKRLHNPNNDKDTVNKDIDLHAMLRNIKRTKLKEFIDNESMSLTPALNTKLELEEVKLNNDDNLDTVKEPAKKKRKKKYNLVSNNFRRLKLPTKSRRNVHWRRRR